MLEMDFKQKLYVRADLSMVGSVYGRSQIVHEKIYSDLVTEKATILGFSRDMLDRLDSKTAIGYERTEPVGAEDDGRPTDETRRLTRMLVAAKSPDEVQSVLADAFNHMREWQALAANGDKKAIAVVRKLNKLVSRGNRKIRDLNREKLLLIRQKKAEKAEKEKVAQRLRDELKQAERVRKQRERRYLQEQDNDKEDETEEFGPTMAATEAKIRALAAAMTAVSTNSPNTGDTGLSDSITEDNGSIENAEVSGGAATIDMQV